MCVCVCKGKRPVFVDFAVFVQIRCASHILDIFCVFSSRSDLRAKKLHHLLKECRFHLTVFLLLDSSGVILILPREQDHSHILVYLRTDLNQVAPTYKVGALLHKPDSPFWGYLLCTFFMKVIFGFDAYWWIQYYIQSGVRFNHEFYSWPCFHVTIHSCFMFANNGGTKFTWTFYKTEYVHINVFLYKLSWWLSTADADVLERCYSHLIFWLLCRTLDHKTCHVWASTLTI